jgi:hypothetical protein
MSGTGRILGVALNTALPGEVVYVGPPQIMTSFDPPAERSDEDVPLLDSLSEYDTPSEGDIPSDEDIPSLD